MPLTLTSCKDGEWSCADGRCISKDRRCNHELDCVDESDEIKCEVFNVLTGYEPNVPPTPVIGTIHLELFFNIKITGIREFSLSNFAITVDAIIYISWKDPRLNFRFSTDTFQSNIGNIDRIWVPDILIEDGSFNPATVDTRLKKVFVKRQSGPITPPLTLVSEGLY